MADEIKRGNFMYAVFKINSDSSSIVLEFAQVVTTINQNDRNDLRSQIKILEELELLLPINELLLDVLLHSTLDKRRPEGSVFLAI